MLVRSAAPSYYLDDSAETCVAAVLVGVPHPPGYPLYTLLSRVFSFFPAGEVPFRLNLLSSLWASASAALLFLLTRKIWKAPLLPSAALALCLPLGSSFWLEATGAKGGYYGLGAFLTLSLAGILFRGGAAAPAALVWGLSLAHHWMSGLVLGGALILASLLYSSPSPAAAFFRPSLPEAPTSLARRGFFLASLFLFAASAYLVLPIRAAARVPLNWEDPSNLGNLLWVFFRRGYLGAEGLREAGRLLGQVRALARTWLSEWGWASPLIFLGILAALLRLRRGADRRSFFLLLLPPLLMALALLLYLNLPSDQLPLYQGYSVPLFPLLLLAAGGSLVFLGDRAGALLLVLPLLLLVRGFAQRDFSRYTFVQDYVRNALSCAPERSLLLARGDGLVFPLWHEQMALGRRPDVIACGVDGIPMKWIRDGLEAKGLPLPPLQGRVGNESKAYLVDSAARQALVQGRMVLLGQNQIEEGMLRGSWLRPRGLLWELRPQGEAGPAPANFDDEMKRLWAGLKLRGLPKPGARDLRTRDQLLRNYAIAANGMGVWFEDEGLERGKGEGCYALSLAWFRRASALAPEEVEYAANAANALHRMGRLEEAAQAYRQALVLDGNYADAWFNLGVTLYKLGRVGEAREAANRVLALKPGHAGAQALLRALP